MPYLLGTDEAGYGPNLGPLVISATVWKVPPGVRGADLYERIEGVVAPAGQRALRRDASNIVMADSKALYQPGKGLRHLERGLLAALAVGSPGDSPESAEPPAGRSIAAAWQDAWELLAPESLAARRAIPWYADYDEPIPIDAQSGDVRQGAETLCQGLDAAGVRLLRIASRAVFPEEFNDLLQRYDSKGSLLSHLTLELVARLIGPLGDEPISIVCDRHGGRKRYLPVLVDHFPESFVEIGGESAERSVYRFGPSNRRVDIAFQTKAESYLPAALASMASKYLRELAMRAFNAFWRARCEGLRATAGYPQDAKRFMKDTAAVRKDLAVDDRVLWRRK